MWSSEELERLRERHEQGESWRTIAASIGFTGNPETFARSMRRQVARLPHPRTAQLVAARRDKRLRDEHMRELRQLTNKRAAIEEIRDRVSQLVTTLPPPCPYRPERLPARTTTDIALFSDWHMGMEVPERLGGGWHQSVEVTQHQARCLVKRLIERAGRSPDLVILDLGDDVEGSHMRVSQSRGVGPLVSQQVALYGRLLAEVVDSLLPYYEHIRVERIPGNHGRVSVKAGNAGLDELDPMNSFDWLAGVVAEGILGPAIDAGRVELINHEGFYAITMVRGHRIVFEHGSSVRGGGTAGGIPWGAVESAAKAYRDLEGEYEALMVGHWHRFFHSMVAGRLHVVANGALPPTTPFVVTSRHQAQRPCQVLCVMGADGLQYAEPLYVDIPRTAHRG